jgi:hypothetical protein
MDWRFHDLVQLIVSQEHTYQKCGVIEAHQKLEG